MTARLAAQTYGKSKIRLTKVTRKPERHELRELDVDVQLEGDFSESYTEGDNGRVVATDTMRNTVYALAADHPLVDAESFALTLAKHFVDRNEQVESAMVNTSESVWQRIPTSAGPHRHSFVGGGVERRVATVMHTRNDTTIESGLTGLPLLKTADSGFVGFPRDEFTTLPETTDRIFATLLDAIWMYGPKPKDFNAACKNVRDAMLACFADHKSLSVQHTLYAMGEAALAACREIDVIRLTMPNQHRIPFNLEPLGKENRNEIFVTTNEPFGVISAVLERGE